MKKAKYEVLRGSKVIYTCITTTRNSEDIINILNDRFGSHEFKYRIKQTIEGVDRVLYDNFIKPIPKEKQISRDWRRKARPILDNKTGKIIPSMTQLAKELGIKQMEVQRRLQKKIPNDRYQLLQQSCLGKY